MTARLSDRSTKLLSDHFTLLSGKCCMWSNLSALCPRSLGSYTMSCAMYWLKKCEEFSYLLSVVCLLFNFNASSSPSHVYSPFETLLVTTLFALSVQCSFSLCWRWWRRKMSGWKGVKNRLCLSHWIRVNCTTQS